MNWSWIKSKQLKAVLPVAILGSVLTHAYFFPEPSHPIMYQSVLASETPKTEVDPLMAEVLRQLEASKNLGQQTGTPKSDSPPITSEGVCKDCEKNVADEVKYETCNSSNNYLDKKLSALELEQDSLFSELLNEEPDPEALISPKCTRMAMSIKLAANAKNFKSCESGSYTSKSEIVRPCINKKYHALMHNSFDLVARCMTPLLGSNAREQKQSILMLMGLFTQESSFHMNAVSGSGAGGVGQMTEGAINFVNTAYLPTIKESFLASGHGCDQIADEFLAGASPMAADKKNSCDRISLSNGNPVTGMVYAMTNIYGMMSELQSDIFESDRYSEKFNLPPQELFRLKLKLAIWSHNTGLAGTEFPLRSLLKSTYARKPVTNVDQFLKEMTAAYTKWPHPENDTSSRRKETSEYLGYIEEQIVNIETATGGYSCIQ